MKLIVVLMVLIATWYFAGMNSRAPMMIVLIGGIIFLVINRIIAFILARKTKVSVPPQKNLMYKNAEIPFYFEVMNNCRLPINKFLLSFTMKYITDKKTVRKRFFGSAGMMAKGQSEQAGFYFTPPYSGKIEITPKSIWVFDYLTLSANARRIKNSSGEVVILPYPKKIRIGMPNIGVYSADPVTEISSDKKGEDHSEIRLVREYQPGDLMRHIHHNYTARTRTLWVKEYQKENDYIFDLILDTSTVEKPDTETMDAFYEIVSSVADSLTEMDVILRVYWYDPAKKGMNLFIAGTKEESTRMVGELIHSASAVKPEDYAAAVGSGELRGFRINTRLEWFFMDQLVFRFTKENVEQELQSNLFDLRG